MTTFIIGLILIIYSLGFMGWGRLIGKILRMGPWPFPFFICLGLAWCIFLGGILNLLGLAYPLALDIVMIAGLCCFIGYFWRHFNAEKFFFYKEIFLSKDFLIRFMPSAAIIFIISIFVTYTLAAPKVFNFQDDMEKYLAHPIRMISTGSLAGSPFSSLGTQTLGGQAFLHGFSAAHWPIAYVNSIDSVFAFILCMTIVFAVSLKAGLPFWIIPLIVMSTIFINPQYVNVSSNFTSSAFFLFLFSGPPVTHGKHSLSLLTPRYIVWVGIVCSALIALKMINLIFVFTYLFLLGVGILLIYSFKDALKWAGKVMISLIVFISPWILLYWPNWVSLCAKVIRPKSVIVGTETIPYSMDVINFFSLKQLPYGFGSTFAHYSFAMILVGFCGLLLFLIKKKAAWTESDVWQFSSCLTPVLLYVFFIVVISPILSGPYHELRYLCPVIIAAVPSALIIAGSALCQSNGFDKKPSSKYMPAILALLSIGLLVSFFPTLLARGKQALRYGSVLSFQRLATSPKYINYNKYALGLEGKTEIQAAQKTVPKGETLVTYTPLALNLDFRHNKIMEIDSGGLINPWVDFPFGQDTRNVFTFFRNADAHYLLWHYRSYAIRSKKLLERRAAQPYAQEHVIASMTLKLEDMLAKMANTAHIIYDNGSILVMELPEQPR